MDWEMVIGQITQRVREELGRRENRIPTLLIPGGWDFQAAGELTRLVALREPQGQTWPQECAGVLLEGLTLGELGLLAAGCPEGAKGAWAARAFLEGKPVFVPAEGVEFFQFQGGGAYYRMFLEKMEFLKGCGLVCCPMAELPEVILRSVSAKPGGRKRLVSAEVVAGLPLGGRLCVAADAIITPLAAELAAGRGVQIIRERK